MKLFSIARPQRQAAARPQHGPAARRKNAASSSSLDQHEQLERERAQDLLRQAALTSSSGPGWALRKAAACAQPLNRANPDVQALLADVLSTCCEQGRREGACMAQYLAFAAACELPASPDDQLLDDLEGFACDALVGVRCARTANESQRLLTVDAAIELHANMPAARKEGIESALGMLVTHAIYSDAGPIAVGTLFGDNRSRVYEEAVDALSDAGLRNSLYIALTSAFLDEQQRFGAAAWFPLSAFTMMQKVVDGVGQMPLHGLRSNLLGLLCVQEKCVALRPRNLPQAGTGWRWNPMPNWSEQVEAVGIEALYAAVDICLILGDAELASEIRRRFCAAAEHATLPSTKLDHLIEAIRVDPDHGPGLAMQLLAVASAVDENTLSAVDMNILAIVSFQLDTGCANVYRVYMHDPESTTVELPYPDWLLARRQVLHDAWVRDGRGRQLRTERLAGVFAASSMHLEGPTRPGLRGALGRELAAFVQEAEGPLVTPLDWSALKQILEDAQRAQA